MTTGRSRSRPAARARFDHRPASTAISAQIRSRSATATASAVISAAACDNSRKLTLRSNTGCQTTNRLQVLGNFRGRNAALERSFDSLCDVYCRQAIHQTRRNQLRIRANFLQNNGFDNMFNPLVQGFLTINDERRLACTAICPTGGVERIYPVAKLKNSLKNV